MHVGTRRKRQERYTGMKRYPNFPMQTTRALVQVAKWPLATITNPRLHSFRPPLDRRNLTRIIQELHRN